MSLLDLDMGGAPAAPVSSAPPMHAAPVAAPENGIMTMLNPAPVHEPTPVQAAAPSGLLDSAPIQNLMGGDDFGGFESAPPEQLYIGFEDSNLKIELKMSKDLTNPSKNDYCALFTNLSGSSLTKA